MSDQRYAEWIKANVSGTGFGDCAKVTAAMAAAFQELRRVRGHYYCFIWGARQHWWLVAGAGEVVDPTCEQFPSKGRGEYVEFTGKDEDLPTGVCMDCGESTYRGDSFCSKACEIATLGYLGCDAGGLSVRTPREES